MPIKNAITILPSFNRIGEFLLTVGPVGLLILSFLDSAGIPTLGGPDIVLIMLAGNSKGLLEIALLILAATVGSVVGCLVLYWLGQKGGELALARFSHEKREKVRGEINHYGSGVIFVSVIAPPPFPMKLVIIMAGVLKMDLKSFLAGVVVGRLLRYTAEGYLAFYYGDKAINLLKSHFWAVFLVVLGVALIFLARRYFRQSKNNASQ